MRNFSFFSLWTTSANRFYYIGKGGGAKMKSSREMYTALEVSKSKEKFGDNYAACKLPQFTGADGNTYQLSGFCGNRLLGVKPQTEMGKAIVCLNLAEYLSSSECQLDRLEQLGWLPSNLQL